MGVETRHEGRNIGRFVSPERQLYVQHGKSQCANRTLALADEAKVPASSLLDMIELRLCLVVPHARDSRQSLVKLSSCESHFELYDYVSVRRH
jgi:hypothetical protein